MDQSTDIRLSARAARQIQNVMAQQTEAKFLRLSVIGGGCTGFSYAFDLVERREPDDLMISRDGASMLIDPMSQGILAGSEIDYVEEIIGSAFKVNNPNAVASCGCGTSFSI